MRCLSVQEDSSDPGGKPLSTPDRPATSGTRRRTTAQTLPHMEQRHYPPPARRLHPGIGVFPKKSDIERNPGRQRGNV